MSKDTKKFKLLHLLLPSFSPVDIEYIEFLMNLTLNIGTIIGAIIRATIGEVIGEIIGEVLGAIIGVICIKTRKIFSQDNYDRPKDSPNPAIKLPFIAYCLDQERQGELIEMREIWCGDRPLTIWTWMSVELKTQQYLIYDHFWFWLRQKVEDRWQPMKRERLPRIKNSD